MKVAIDSEACFGCRLCELACSFHHIGAFSPNVSSIKVSSNFQTGEMRLSIDSTCDLCVRESGPKCIEFCPYGALKETKNNG